MKKIIILRGSQGSGKTTLVQKLNLQKFSVSPDTIRDIYCTPVLNEQGEFKRIHNWKIDGAVFQTIEKIIHNKMERGETIVYDATNPTKSSFSDILIKAKFHKYKVAIFDFYDMDFKDIIAQNQNRGFQKINEDTLKVSHEKGQNLINLPQDILHIFSKTDPEKKRIQEFLEDSPVFDANAFEKIIFFGDTQGCFDPLKHTNLNINNKKILFVFCGDLLDRGPQNHLVLEWAIQNLIGRENVIFIEGNHETHLNHFANHMKSFSKEFETKTKPQILAHKIKKSDISELLSNMIEVCDIHFKGQIFFVNHGGLPCYIEPHKRWQISSSQYFGNIGDYDTKIDTAFTKSLNPENQSNIIQIHGHRNTDYPDHQKNLIGKSFTVEDSVENNGNLILIEANSEGLTRIEIPNINPNLKKELKKSFIAPWNDGTYNAKPIDEEQLEKIQKSKLIHIKSFDYNVKSYNFTSKAFQNNQWDEVSLFARGCFLENRNFIARSWPKYFELTLADHSFTKLEDYFKTANWPLRLFVKENGYLGITGYNQKDPKCFVSSKTSCISDFKYHFEKILHNYFPHDKNLKTLKKFNKDHGASLLFEVIDPNFDPHIISYDKAKIVLLDCVRRAPQFEATSYEDLLKIGEKFQLPTKEVGPVFKNAEQLVGFLKQASTYNYQWKNNFIEGFVAVDAHNNYVGKIKTGYYSYWKYMRSLQERIKRHHNKGHTLNLPKEENFVEWMLTKDFEIINTKSIIDLRELYLKETNKDF